MFGEARDGKLFNEESPEVVAELAAHPELNLDVAIGNVIMAYEKSLSVEEVKEEVNAEEPAAETPAVAEGDVAETAEVVAETQSE